MKKIACGVLLFGKGLGSTQELIDLSVLAWKGDGGELPSPPFWTEELVLLSHMRKSGPMTPRDMLRLIKEHVAKPSWRHDEVKSRIQKLQEIMTVPFDLHFALLSLIRAGETNTAEITEALEEVFPSISEYVVSHWVNLCVRELLRGETDACMQVVNGNGLVWSLSAVKFQDHLKRLEEAELDRIGELQSAKKAETTKTVRHSVIWTILVGNHKSFDDMLRGVNRKLTRKHSITLEELKNIYKEIMGVTEQTCDFHLQVREGSNTDAETERFWRKWCVEPLLQWEALKEPQWTAPCQETNGKVRLSTPQKMKYLRELLKEYE